MFDLTTASLLATNVAKEAAHILAEHYGCSEKKLYNKLSSAFLDNVADLEHIGKPARAFGAAIVEAAMELASK
jgi:hypothetical protein